MLLYLCLYPTSYWICVLILLLRVLIMVCVRRPARPIGAKNASLYVSSYYNICVLILLYMCPRMVCVRRPARPSGAKNAADS